MARIAQLSDLHFGAHDPQIVDAVLKWLEDHRPDLVIISGDLTQRARRNQFKLAASFVGEIRDMYIPLLIVAGNHDVPLYDVIRRFMAPLRRYKHYIEPNLCPWFENDEVAVLGINTARSLTIKDGRINESQIQIIKRRFENVATGKTRLLVTHHPLFSMPIGKGNELTEAVGRHENAINTITNEGIHIALAGHFHRTYAEAASKMVKTSGPALVIQAGTTTSTRLRNDEPQSFNWLHTNGPDDIELQVICWDGAAFGRASHTGFRYRQEHWHMHDIFDE